MTRAANVFADLPRPSPHEHHLALNDHGAVTIERIVSHGHSSPPGFWYDQETHEWVMVLRGAARLLFEGDERPVEMKPGDSIEIPARKKHRVEWTAPDEPTIWLAVHFR